MPIHVTIDPLVEDGWTGSQLAEVLQRLKPATVQVDCAGGGRVLLASLQAHGIPATVLEKRPRPALAEVMYAQTANSEANALKAKLEDAERELRHLREYRKHVGALIERLE